MTWQKYGEIYWKCRIVEENGRESMQYGKNNFTAERNAANVEELYYEIVQKEEKNDKICIFDFKL